MKKCLICKKLKLDNSVKNNQEILKYIKDNPKIKIKICSCNAIRLRL